MDEKEIQKRIKSGAILAQVSFEVIGNPKEHVEKTIRDFLDNIRKDSDIKILSEEYGEAEEQEGGLFSTYCDSEMLVASFDKFNWLCVNFMPASIEVISPAVVQIKDVELTLGYNDLLAKLHEISAGYRQLSVKEELFVKNMNAMIQNSVLLACESVHDPHEIARKLGIEEAQLRLFINTLLDKNKLVEKDGKYYRH